MLTLAGEMQKVSFNVNLFELYTKKTSTSKFYGEVTYFFQLSLFSNVKATSKSMNNRVISSGISHVNKTALRRIRYL